VLHRDPEAINLEIGNSVAAAEGAVRKPSGQFPPEVRNLKEAQKQLEEAYKLFRPVVN